jgi:hypothetical protein
VPKRALTPGTLMYLNADITSGRLYRYTPLRPIPASGEEEAAAAAAAAAGVA